MDGRMGKGQGMGEKVLLILGKCNKCTIIVNNGGHAR
jgi:hypothetical protein